MYFVFYHNKKTGKIYILKKDLNTYNAEMKNFPRTTTS